MFQQADFVKFQATMASRAPAEVAASHVGFAERFQANRANQLADRNMPALDQHNPSLNERAFAGLATISLSGWALAAEVSGEPVLDGQLSVATRTAPPSQATRTEVASRFQDLVENRRQAPAPTVRGPRMGR